MFDIQFVLKFYLTTVPQPAADGLGRHQLQVRVPGEEQLPRPRQPAGVAVVQEAHQEPPPLLHLLGHTLDDGSVLPGVGRVGGDHEISNLQPLHCIRGQGLRRYSLETKLTEKETWKRF